MNDSAKIRLMENFYDLCQMTDFGRQYIAKSQKHTKIYFKVKPSSQADTPNIHYGSHSHLFVTLRALQMLTRYDS